MIRFLSNEPAESLDRYVLLDAQDWMDDAALNALWREMTRTARPGARVIFRTAGEDSILPGRVSNAILNRWNYDQQRSAEIHAKDRSAIYGGFHLYVNPADGAIIMPGPVPPLSRWIRCIAISDSSTI